MSGLRARWPRTSLCSAVTRQRGCLRSRACASAAFTKGSVFRAYATLGAGVRYQSNPRGKSTDREPAHRRTGTTPHRVGAELVLRKIRVRSGAVRVVWVPLSSAAQAQEAEGPAVRETAKNARPHLGQPRPRCGDGDGWGGSEGARRQPIGTTRPRTQAATPFPLCGCRPAKQRTPKTCNDYNVLEGRPIAPRTARRGRLA